VHWCGSLKFIWLNRQGLPSFIRLTYIINFMREDISMKNKHILAVSLVFLIAALAVLYSQNPISDPVTASHRICQKDSDCTVISIGCGCCGSGDTQFRFDAVNAQFAEEYKSLAQCTEKQRNRCAATDCAIGKEPYSVCQSSQCAVKKGVP
jgi:argininosuccinate synthase